MKSNVHIDFFLRRNPGFENGDELTCMTELSIDNMKRFTKNNVLEGMKYPIHFVND